MPPHLWRAMSSSALPFVLREATTASAELTAVYVVSTLFLLVACIGCGMYRNRRRDAEELRSNHRAQLAAAFREASTPVSPRFGGKSPRIHSFIPEKDVADAPCPICLEQLGTSQASKGLCGHPLHTACLIQWLVRDPHFSCPVCRTTYETASPQRRCSSSVADGDDTARCSGSPRSEADTNSDDLLEDIEGDASIDVADSSAPGLYTSNVGDVVLSVTEDAQPHAGTRAITEHVQSSAGRG